MSKILPTPIPYRSTETGEVLAVAGGYICCCGDADDHGKSQDQANAEFIARACNAHADLLAACKELCERLEGLHAVNTPNNPCSRINQAAYDRAKAVIAKVEGVPR